MSSERKQKNIRDRRLRDPYDRDDDGDNIFSSTFFGDDLFNRNKQQRKKTYDEENENNINNNYMQTEPADINRKENEEKDDAGMKVEKRNKSNETKNYRTIYSKRNP